MYNIVQMENSFSRETGIHLPDVNQTVVDAFPNHTIDKLFTPATPQVVVSAEKDMDPSWEFDYQAGRIRDGDILTNEYGERFFVTKDGLQSMTVGQASKSVVTSERLALVASSFPEEGKPIFQTKGLVEQLEKVKSSSFSELTKDMLDKLISKNFQQQPYMVYTGRGGRKEFNKALRQAIQQRKLTSYEETLYNDELSYDLTLEDRRSLLENYIHDLYGKGELSHSGFEEKMDAIDKWYHSKTPHSTSNSGTITDAHTILLHPASAKALPAMVIPEEYMQQQLHSVINPPPPYPGAA